MNNECQHIRLKILDLRFETRTVSVYAYAAKDQDVLQQAQMCTVCGHVTWHDVPTVKAEVTEPPREG